MTDYENDADPTRLGEGLGARARRLESLTEGEREWIAASTGDRNAALSDAQTSTAAVEGVGDRCRGGDATQLGDLPAFPLALADALSSAGVDTGSDLFAADLGTLAASTGYDRALLWHWRELVRHRFK